MKKLRIVTLFTLVFLAFLGMALLPSLITPARAQVYFYTPTAEPNGNIYYVIKDGDTCDSIALLNNVPVDTIRNYNQLDLDACRFLQVGNKLLIGVVPTSEITVLPSPTPTSNLPTSEPEKGYGIICVYLYDDINGNAMAETDEITNTGLAGGEISVTNTDGSFSKTGTTLNTGEAVCFDNVPEGEYTITIAIPDGYNPTSGQTKTITLKAGDTSTVDFSAQVSTSLITVVTKNKTSPLLAVLGGVILLAGLGLGLYVRYFLRR